MLIRKKAESDQFEWRKKLLNGGSGTVVIKLVNLALVFLLNIMLARYLGAAELGVYAFAVAIVTILSIPAKAGLPTLLVREISIYSQKGQWGLLRGLLIRGTQFVSAASLLLISGGAALVWLFKGASEVASLTLLVAFPLILLIALSELRVGALRGLHRVIEAQVPEMLVRPIFLCVFIAVVANSSFGALDAIFGYVMAALLSFIVGGVFLLRALPKQVQGLMSVYEDKRWLNSMVPLALLTGMQIINSQADVVILGLMGSTEDVGLYRIAMQAATLVTLSLYAVNMVVGPYFSRFYESGDMQNFQRMVTMGSRFSVFGALPIAAVFVFFGENLLGVLFGAEFVESYWALIILATGYLLSVCFGSVVLVLTMTGFEADAMKGAALAAMINIILNIILIPVLGMVGAALATVTSLLIWNIKLFLTVKKKVGINSSVFYHLTKN